VVGAWLAAAKRPEVERAIAAIHEDLAQSVREFKPLCLASGACCKFDAFEHRLYATGLEAARCVLLGPKITSEDLAQAKKAGTCPWQVGRLCTAREGRPVGCRVFFCDPRAKEWVPERAEWAHGEIKALHERFDVPYAYGEWRAMLEQILLD
jgi:Fe-S-cluster containining protein